MDKGKAIDRIRKQVAREFPGDPALQQIHIARKLIAKEAREKGVSYLEYVKILASRARRSRPKSRAGR